MEFKVIKEAIKHQYNRYLYKSLDEYLKTDCKTDDHAVTYGPLTTELASRMGVTLSKARYHLNKYHKKGLLAKQDASGGCCRWWYYGLLDEIKQSV